jgi:8-hydroxy-5-deazaflavin:NADPH oxidoreductase
MKIGILGSGDVGRALGSGFVGRGHDVKIGSRKPKSAELVAWREKAGAKASTGTFAEAAKHGEVVLLAVRGAGAEEAIRLAGTENFGTKVVIDVTNPLDASGGPGPGIFVGLTDSLGERIQRILPKAKVVKCFNTVSNTQMVDPKYAGGVPEMLIAGNDPAAKKKVVGILKEFGWPGALDVGGIEGARWLEAIVPLWVLVGMQIGRWDHAFKVVHG